MHTAFFTMFPLRNSNRTYAVRSPRTYTRMVDAVEAAIQGNMHPTWDKELGPMTAVECLVGENGRVFHLSPLPWEIVDCRHPESGPFPRAHYGETLLGPELAGYQFGLRQTWSDKHDVYPFVINVVGKDLRGDQEATQDLVQTAGEQFRKMVLRYVKALELHEGNGQYCLPIGLAITHNAVHIVADARLTIDYSHQLKAA